MKLHRHREDLKWLETHVPHREVDDQGCVLCGIIKRQRNLISFAEAILTPPSDYTAIERREKLVLKDAGK